MREANFTVSSMHGDMPQKERDTIMKDFRAGARLAFYFCYKFVEFSVGKPIESSWIMIW